MPTTKHAAIRYQALDRCFRNPYKEFFIEDLIEVCSQAIMDYDGSDEGISRRTIFNDISFMRSDAGWEAPIESYYDGKKKYYRYSDPEFTINRKDLTDTEISQLKETIMMLNRFRGLPNFDWMDEMVTNLEDKFGLKGGQVNVIGYEQNPYLNGIDYLSPLFNYIINEQALVIGYDHYFKGRITWKIHPYYIKQYNNRWFLFGLNDELKSLTNIPLDRISSIEPTNIRYIRNTSVDFDEYFDDIIGVTVPNDGIIETVTLQFVKERFPYILSKPLHPSQRVVDRDGCIVEIEVYLNKELEALVLSFGSQVRVLAPDALKERVISNIKDSFNYYFAVQNDCTGDAHLCNVKQ